MKIGVHHAFVLAFVLSSCAQDVPDPLTGEPAGAATVRIDQNDARLAAVGQKVFFDKNLSIGRNQACASCHDPAFGFTSPDAAANAHGAVLEGSIAGRFAIRKPPSAAYAMAPVFFYDAE